MRLRGLASFSSHTTRWLKTSSAGIVSSDLLLALHNNAILFLLLRAQLIMSSFVPRAVFSASENLTRSYFLGHHRAGIQKMKSMLERVDHVIECRDSRVPATSINPVFEEVLGEKRRDIVYTKRDLTKSSGRDGQSRQNLITRWEPKTTKVFFMSKMEKNSSAPILKYFRTFPLDGGYITGYRVLVVGMPNVGKSTLINTLRSVSQDPNIRKKAVATTGADPGVTRKIGTAIKIVDRGEVSMYVYDTPGVFVPYMPDGESMLKLALCGIIKDNLIPMEILADYLLFRLNLENPHEYASYSEPTNDIMELLKAMAKKSGRLGKGGVLDIEAAGRLFISMWRSGKLGRFALDNVTSVSSTEQQAMLASHGGSMNQARKLMKQRSPVNKPSSP